MNFTRPETSGDSVGIANAASRALVVLTATAVTILALLAIPRPASADWHPLAPVNSSGLNTGPVATETDSDGSAAGLWIFNYNGGPALEHYSADGQTLGWSFATDYTLPGSGEINYASALATDYAHHVLYVGDSENDRIVSFDVSGTSATALHQSPDGVLTECPGSGCPAAGNADGQFDGISDIAFYNGEVYAADPRNARIQVFDASLNYERSITSAGWTPPIDDGPEGYHPNNMAVNPADGDLYLAMSDNETIEVYSSSGTYLRSLTVPYGSVWTLAIDGTNNVLYVSAGSAIFALDPFTGAQLGEVKDYADDWLSAGVFGLVVQPAERVLLTGYWYEFASEDWRSDIVDRFGYDAAPTCLHPTSATEINTAVAINLSCTDTTASPAITYEITAQPAHGTISGFNSSIGGLTYAPTQNFAGADSFRFRAHSNTGVSGEYTAQITVSDGPVIRKSANLVPLAPGVRILLPGSDTWILLEEAKLIPVGTIIDARNGRAQLTMANADGSTYTGDFWGGVFQVVQGSGSNPITTLKLRDDIAGKPTETFKASSKGVVIARKRGKRKNGLWGSGKGKFRTSGRGGSASVRGTIWWVANYANGTAFKVARGVVKVTPLHCPAFDLKAGRSAFIYFENQNAPFIGKRKHKLVRDCNH